MALGAGTAQAAPAEELLLGVGDRLLANAAELLDLIGRIARMIDPSRAGCDVHLVEQNGLQTRLGQQPGLIEEMGRVGITALSEVNEA